MVLLLIVAVVIYILTVGLSAAPVDQDLTNVSGPGLCACPRYLSMDDEEAPEQEHHDPKAVRLARRIISVEGAPIWGLVGWLEWVLLALALVGLFVLAQELVGMDQLEAWGVPRGLWAHAWYWAVLGYGGSYVLHWLLTTRDG